MVLPCMYKIPTSCVCFSRKPTCTQEYPHAEEYDSVVTVKLEAFSPGTTESGAKLAVRGATDQLGHSASTHHV